MKTLWNFLAIAELYSLSQARTRHECIHDSEIVPTLMNQEDHPLIVVQSDSDGLGPTRLRRLANTTGRQEVLRRRLVAGRGAKFRITPDFKYLDGNKYHCTKAGSSIEDVNTNKGSIPCTPEDVVDDETKQYIQKLVLAAIEWFERALRVLHPVRGHLKLEKNCYQYIPPPAFDSNTRYEKECRRPGRCPFESPDTDFYMYVTANPTQGNTLAWALTCLSDDATGRPIAGFVNFGPAKLTKLKENWESELSTAIHEISHALGFSSSKFDDFIDAQGNPLGKANVVRTFQDTPLGREVVRIITPRVVEQVRNQFGCYDWPDAGGELEDYGGSGTAGSHWEKRVFRNEFMTGTDSANPVISAVSLALFEDSGWYIADYSAAEHLHWGHKAGCTFGAHKCSKWDARFFCRDESHKGYTHDRLSKGFCNRVSFQSALPRQHQYFKEKTDGGSDAHSDYCPYVHGYSNQNCLNPSHTGPQSEAVFGEKYSQESRCFDATAIADGYKLKGDGPGQRCYKHACEDGLLRIFLGKTKIECPETGGIVDAPKGCGFKGKIWCPRADEVCVARSDASPKPQGKERSHDSVKCDSGPHDFKIGDKAIQIQVSKDKVACFRMRVEKSSVGKAIVKSDGQGSSPLVGKLFMQSITNSEKQDGITKVSGEKVVVDSDASLTWPSATENDASGNLDKTSKEVSISSSLLENAKEIRFSFVGSGKGSLKLELGCLYTCLHGGRCQGGACTCKDGWTGIRCEDKECPNACSEHGDCDASRGVCTCHVGWRGSSCGEQEKPNGDWQRGTVPHGSWAYYYITCDGNDRSEEVRLEYRLQKESEGSQPMLYAQIGDRRPTLSQFETRDRASWKSGSNVHVVKVNVRNGIRHGATIGIYNNPEYGHRDLKYTGTKECIPIRTVAPCPKTRSGECNKQGECKFDAVKNVNTCECKDGWRGVACDAEVASGKSDDASEEDLQMTLRKDQYRYVQIQVPTNALGKAMTVKISGIDQFMLISVNKLTKKPKASEPKTCDASKSCHNGWDKFKFGKTKISQVRIDQARYPLYTALIINKGTAPARFNVQISFGDSSSSSFAVIDDGIKTKTSNLALLESFASEDTHASSVDDPIVPLSLVASDGSLPDPVLAMSSRSLVEGIASSKVMRLLKVEEFCSQSRSGLYVKCSKMDGTLTVCTDRPAVVFHGLKEREQPKDILDFTSRSETIVGAPSKTWEHLRSWQDACLNYKQVEVDKDNSFVGVAALESGQYVTFTAVMQGKKSLFLTDEGAVRPIFGMIGVSVVSVLVTAFVMTSVYFGWWYRKKRAQENVKRISHVWRANAAAARESRRLTEMANLGHATPTSGAHNAPKSALKRHTHDAAHDHHAHIATEETNAATEPIDTEKALPTDDKGAVQW